MAQRHLDFGTSVANDGETIHSAFQKIEDNTADLYARVGGVEDDVADLYSRVGGVSTVNGEEGAVVLDATEIDIDSLVPANYTPSDPSIEGHLEGIDDALSFAGGGDMLSTNNLSDVSNASTARANLGLTIGTDVQAYDADLAALAGLTTTGIVVRSGSGTASTCGLVAGAGISVTNNDGVSGSPSIAVDVSGLSDRPSFTSGAKIPVSIGGALYKFDYDDLPGAGGGISAAFANVTDGSATAAASGSGTFKLRVGTGLTVAVTNNDATHGDNALFSLDDELVALAGLTSAADKLPYFTGSGTAGVTDLTSFGRSLIDDADAVAARTTLGLGTLGTMSSQDATNVAITGGSIAGITDLAVADGGTGSSTAAGAFSNLKQAATTSATGVTELATASEFRANTAGNLALSPAEVWSGAALAELTDGATISVDLSAGFNFGGTSDAVLALGGNRTLGAPSNLKTGQNGVLWFGASASTRTLTLNAAWLLIDDVETGPYSITTAQILGVAYVVRASDVYVTAILRRAA